MAIGPQCFQMQKYDYFLITNNKSKKIMEPEENNTNQQRPLVPKTIRVQAEDNDQWKLIKDNLVQANNRTISVTEVFLEASTRQRLPINQTL